MAYLQLGWIQTLGGPVPGWWPAAGVEHILTSRLSWRSSTVKTDLSTESRVTSGQHCKVKLSKTSGSRRVALGQTWRMAGLDSPVWVSWSRTPKALSTTLEARSW